MNENIRQHVPVLEWNKDIGLWILKCRVCHMILWESDDEECNPKPPTLGINVRDGTGVGEKVG